jgi:Tfp pilus assembly protein PilX
VNAKFHAGRSGRQRGMTLLISLIMLVVLTLFAITAIRTGNVGFKIVGNQQAQKLMEAAAQQAIEQVISNLANFDPVAVIAPSATVAQRVCVNAAAGDPPAVIPPTSCTSGIQVDVAPVRCIASKRSQFDSLTQVQATFDNVWEIVATVTDSVSGAKATYHQGVKIRMLSSSCPGLSTT